MKRKEAVYKGLEFIPVLFEDTSLTSPEYFQITEFPTRLTAGKNLFKLRGHPTNLRVGSVLGVEVLDYNGDPIYSEVVDFIDEDKSRVIAIYIYPDTSPGDCTVTLIGEAINVPIDWQGRVNTRWTRTVPVNPNVSNISEIIFEQVPVVTVQEIIGVQLDRQYPVGQFPTFNSGSVRLFSQNNQPVIELQGAEFTSDMSTGTITIPTPINPTPTPSYPIPTTTFTTTIKKILSPTTALLDGEYTAYSNQTLSAHTFTAFDWSAYSLEYQATPQYTLTENSQSFAYVEIEGLQPATGDVSRVKIFTNNNGTVANWELVNDIELPETEIFVTSTASLLPDQAVGVITSQQHVDTYWTASTWHGPNLTTTPTLTYTTASLNAAIQITTPALTQRNQAAVVSTKTTGRFISGSSYRVTFDALGAQGELAVYLSGSAFDIDNKDYYNQEFGIPFGKRVGSIAAQGVSQRFDDKSFSFNADRTGYGVLNVVIESGEWQIADIHVTSDNDAGYTPNYTRIKTPIQTTHKIDNQIDFRVEYYNVNGEKSRQESFVLNKDWEGGNRYIDGDYSMLTGSLYVADSLNSGVAISGYPNSGFVRSLGYEGFYAGFPGFLLWSGSAMPNSLGTKGGVPYSGVGLELFANGNSYFRYSTTDNEIEVRTDKFFFGNPATTFISGSNSLLEISSSGFHLQPNGSVTASSFIAINNGNVLFDSNNQYADGLNIGRVVYFDRSELTITGVNLNTNPQTSSLFETFILPGETRMQVSLMYNFRAAASSAGTLRGQWYIQSSSITGSNGSVTGYDGWSSPQALFSTNQIISNINSVGSFEGASITYTTSGTTTTLSNYQGKYVRIFMITDRNSAGDVGDQLAMKGFVYRTSRSVGGSINPPSSPVLEEVI